MISTQDPASQTGLRILLAAFICLSSAACSMKPSAPTGFIKGDYSKLKKGSSGSLKSRVPPSGSLAKYTRVTIDPVIVQKHKDAEMEGIDETELAQLKSYFNAQLREEFGKSYQVVSRRGSNVLRVRVAITDARGTTPVLNIHWSTLLTRAGVGGCAMEAEFSDSRSGRQLAAFMDNRMGKITGYFNGFNSIGHAKQVIRDWAKSLREALDEARGVKQPETTEKKPSRSRKR